MSRRNTASISLSRHTDNASQVVAQRAEKSQVLELIVEDSQLNVYAGELEVRPRGAPTARPDGRRVDSCEPGATADRAIEFVSGICSVTKRCDSIKLRP